MENSKDRFSSRVENYIKYRPDYPVDGFNFVFTKTGCTNNSIVAEIGSGTGIFTKCFDDKVKQIFAVEPNNEMRDAAERLLVNQKNFISINGDSENTTLPGNSVDAVFAAQSFHWFNTENTKREFKRILKQDGYVVLVWNNRLMNTDFLAEYENLLKQFANDYNEVNHNNLTENDFRRFYSNYERIIYPNKQSFDLKGLIGRLLSSSYSPSPGENNFDLLYAKLEDLFHKYNSGGKIDFNYQTVFYIGRI